MGRTKGAKNKSKEIYNLISIDTETDVVENFQQEPIDIISVVAGKRGRKKGSKNKDKDIQNVDIVEDIIQFEENENEKIIHCSDNQKYSYKKYHSGSGIIHQYICLTI